MEEGVSKSRKRQIRDIECFGSDTEWGKVFPSQPTRESVGSMYLSLQRGPKTDFCALQASQNAFH